jgi:type I restriction enzyme S subunit
MNIRQAQLPEGDALNLPKGWEIKKLGEVCEMYQPKTISKKEMVVGGPYPVFGANGIIGNFDKYNHEEAQLLITCRGATCGSVNISEPKSWINGNAMVIRSKENSIDLKFLEYLFLGGIDLSKTITGAAQPQITRQSLFPVEISFPKPLPEQQRIVSILDEAFAAIDKAKANAEQNLKNAKELFESYLQGIVTNGKQWEKKTLAQISKTFGRGKSKHRPRNWKGLYGGDYPFIQTGDIRNSNHYITEYSQTYNEVGLAQSKLWSEGTICITIAANIAETGILTFDACFPDSIIGIEVNEKLADRDFVEYLLQSFKVRIQSLGKGSAQANINMGTFENELFPFPPVAEQKTIVENLNQLSAECNKLEVLYESKIADLEELKKSVLQKAFAGELKVSELGWVGLKDDKIKMNT